MSQREEIDWKAIGRYGRRVKGARRAHIVIRASGRVPGEEARAARWAHKKADACAEEAGEKTRVRCVLPPGTY